MNFTITPAAQKFMRMMLRAAGGAGSGFRLAVSPGGCSGLAADITTDAAAELQLTPGEQVYFSVKAQEITLHPVRRHS